MTGLRERKKQATREALMDAALGLALERGLENVRVEDVAERVGVSPRTFNNYFSSKYEALAARHTDRVRRTVAVLRARPAAEPLWEALIAAVAEPWEQAMTSPGPPDADRLALTRLLAEEPALRAEALKAQFAADGELAAAVAERTGTDPDEDLYPHLVAATVSAAVQVAVGHWLRSDPPVPLVPVLREALHRLAAGLPSPHPRTEGETS
ncbi:TetR/AcrR family transcriptional regulator [Actinomadura sp. ATCC 39365]|uniref:TetR/AcrR family transcriptional regulator n=1 Tax=Nonomuraea sp. NPDC005692 TaxID=3157168 RepID=UPI0033EDC994